MADEELPIEGLGVKPLKIKAVDEAAAEYERCRDRRQSASRKEVEAKTKLLDVLHQNEKKIGRDGEHVLRYRFGDRLIILEPEGEKLRVRDADDEAGE